jgi:hypothetical protein
MAALPEVLGPEFWEGLAGVRRATYRRDYRETTGHGPRDALLAQVARAFGVARPELVRAVDACLAAARAGELAGLLARLRDPEASVELTELAVDRDAGAFRVGLGCRLPGDGERAYGLRLHALGVLVRVRLPSSSAIAGAAPAETGGAT